jgi:hypothetical protein
MVISALRIRVDVIGNKRVTPGIQNDSQPLTEWRQLCSIVHQGRLKSAIDLETSGIVEESIRCRGSV